MKRFAIAAALVVAAMQPVAAGAASECYSPAAVEAEQGMRFLIDLMVASTACHDQTYGLFQQRNKNTVLSYQKAMIQHFHGNAGYDRWDTMLANQAALKQAGKSAPQACQEAAALIKTAAAMDDTGFRSYAASQVASAVATGRYPKCGR